jgi:hypothetical protein
MPKRKQPATPSPVVGGAPLPRGGVGMGHQGPLDGSVAVANAVAAAKAERVGWAGWKRPLPGAQP